MMNTFPVPGQLAIEKKGATKGFTLVELLVVIAIISLLAAIIFPVFERVRENARQTECLSNTKQISMGILQYEQDNDEYLPTSGPQYSGGNPSPPDYSWKWMIYPYVRTTDVFACPSINDPKNQNSRTEPAGTPTPAQTATFELDYSSNAGGGGCGSAPMPNAFPGNTSVLTAAVVVPSQTILIGEGGTPSLQAYYSTNEGPNYGNTVAHHFNGTNFAFADGHAKWMLPLSTNSVTDDWAIQNIGACTATGSSSLGTFLAAVAASST